MELEERKVQAVCSDEDLNNTLWSKGMKLVHGASGRVENSELSHLRNAPTKYSNDLETYSGVIEGSNRIIFDRFAPNQSDQSFDSESNHYAGFPLGLANVSLYSYPLLTSGILNVAAKSDVCVLNTMESGASSKRKKLDVTVSVATSGKDEGGMTGAVIFTTDVMIINSIWCIASILCGVPLWMSHKPRKLGRCRLFKCTLHVCCVLGMNSGVFSRPDVMIDQNWRWIGGSSAINEQSSYVDKGSFSSAHPCARWGAASWVSQNNTLYLFAGFGKATGTESAYLNDMFAYDLDVQKWKWLGGDTTTNSVGSYPGQYVAGAMPSARIGPLAWFSKGNPDRLLLYGGTGVYGSGETTDTHLLSDMFDYDISSNIFRWIGGYSTGSHSPNTTFPGSRQPGGGWIGDDGEARVFGGNIEVGVNHDTVVSSALYKYDSNTGLWTYEGGNQVAGSTVYGTLDVFSSSTWPAGSVQTTVWPPRSNERVIGFWGTNSTLVPTNDAIPWFYSNIFAYDLTNHEWAWLGGSQQRNTPSEYGTMGVFDVNTRPSARAAAAAWSSTDLPLYFVFGGWNADGSDMNDLFAFNVTSKTWAWIGGATAGDVCGNYTGPNSWPGTRRSFNIWLLQNGTALGGFGAGRNCHGSGDVSYSDIWVTPTLSRVLPSPAMSSTRTPMPKAFDTADHVGIATSVVVGGLLAVSGLHHVIGGVHHHVLEQAGAAAGLLVDTAQSVGALVPIVYKIDIRSYIRYAWPAFAADIHSIGQQVCMDSTLDSVALPTRSEAPHE